MFGYRRLLGAGDDARAVVLLKDHGQIGDEIVEDVVTAKMGNVIRLGRRDQGQIKSLRPLARRRVEFIRGRSLNKQTLMGAQLS